MVKKRLAVIENIPQAASMLGFQILAIPLNTIVHGLSKLPLHMDQLANNLPRGKEPHNHQFV